MKTAIEWLEEKINERLNHLIDYKIHIKEFVRTAKYAEVRNILKYINEAKKMEKMQHEKTWTEAMFCETGDIKAFEDYYNKTLKNER